MFLEHTQALSILSRIGARAERTFSTAWWWITQFDLTVFAIRLCNLIAPLIKTAGLWSTDGIGAWVVIREWVTEHKSISSPEKFHMQHFVYILNEWCLKLTSLVYDVLQIVVFRYFHWDTSTTGGTRLLPFSDHQGNRSAQGSQAWPRRRVSQLLRRRRQCLHHSRTLSSEGTWRRGSLVCLPGSQASTSVYCCRVVSEG